MKLHYQISGSGPALLIVHGLFGSSDNWRAIAKQLANHVQVITVDLRNHGQSPHSSEQNYQLMAEDLAELVSDLSLQRVDVIGHSIGGKTAMVFCEQFPEMVRNMMVLDMAPRQYEDGHSELFEALLAVDLTKYTKRSEVDSVLATAIPEKAIRQFLLMNLAVTEQKLVWRPNLRGLLDNYSHLLAAVCEDSVVDVASCFIRGGRSNYILSSDEIDIQQHFPQSEIVCFDNVGHWIHAEAPQVFLTKVMQFFNYD